VQKQLQLGDYLLEVKYWGDSGFPFMLKPRLVDQSSAHGDSNDHAIDDDAYGISDRSTYNGSSDSQTDPVFDDLQEDGRANKCTDICANNTASNTRTDKNTDGISNICAELGMHVVWRPSFLDVCWSETSLSRCWRVRLGCIQRRTLPSAYMPATMGWGIASKDREYDGGRACTWVHGRLRKGGELC
jgi:hypothetical protein